MTTTSSASIVTIPESLKEFTPDVPSGTISVIPEELIHLILNQNFISAYDYANFRKVCKLWLSKLTEKEPICTLQLEPFTIKYVHPSYVEIYGQAAWKKYYGHKIEGEIPPPPNKKNLLETIKQFREYFTKDEKTPTCSLVLMPKGLTLEKLSDWVQKPLFGNKTKFKDESFPPIITTFGNKAIEKSYWVLIIDDVIQGTRDSTFRKQKTILGDKIGKEWEVLHFLEAAVCAFMNYVSTGKCVFHEAKPATSTRCLEEINKSNVSVGGFDLEGLDLHISRTSPKIGLSACQRYGYEPDAEKKDH